MNLQGMHVVLRGNPNTGYTVVGPFQTGEAALMYCGGLDDSDWWITPLVAPGQVQRMPKASSTEAPREVTL